MPQVDSDILSTATVSVETTDTLPYTAPPLRLSTEDDAPWSLTDYTQTHNITYTSSYLTGIEGTPRKIGYGENSWLSALIVVMLIAVALNFGNYRRLFKNFGDDLTGVRRRSNAFDERTSNESRSYIIIILLLCICEGILIFTSGLVDIRPATSVGIFLQALAMMGAAAGLYIFQYAAYNVVGYAFTDPVSARQWLRGFNASQALLAALILLPALISLYYPVLSSAMFAVGCGAYILARIFFIFKGFKVFFDNILSIVYFILYLCTLEITPVVLLRRVASLIN